MQTVCVWSQSHLDPPLTSSKEGPGVQDFLKKGATVRAHTVGTTPSLMPPIKIVLRAITKEASVFFDCLFYRDHWPDMMMGLTPIIYCFGQRKIVVSTLMIL
jgi:hypothetical protein